MANKFEDLDVVDFKKIREEREKAKEEKRRKREEDNAIISAVNRNHEMAMEEQRRIERAKKNARERKKIAKKKLKKIMVTGTTSLVIATGAAWGAVKSYQIMRGQSYIIDKINEIDPTGGYSYFDVSNIDSDINNPNISFIRRGGDTPESVAFYNYSESNEIMKYINNVIVGSGFPEEWTPIYIEETVGTNRYNEQFKGNDFVSMINTKLEAYEMWKAEEKAQKEGISR